MVVLQPFDDPAVRTRFNGGGEHRRPACRIIQAQCKGLSLSGYGNLVVYRVIHRRYVIHSHRDRFRIGHYSFKEVDLLLGRHRQFIRMAELEIRDRIRVVTLQQLLRVYY